MVRAAGHDPVQLIGGRYRVERTLGSGGSAHVCEVRDTANDRQLALKRLTPPSDQRSLALFEREYCTLTSLHHPNIVEVYDYARDVQGPYYTMELLRGADVSQLAPRPWTEVCRILRELASALALLHARRYVHRDISARNVWLTPDARVKLIDFGTLAPFGRRGDVAGTPPFIAPEALHGNELDQRTDLYSVGALGYWLLTGMHAFPARSLGALDELWKQPPRAASHRVAELKRKDLPEVPPALDALIEALLSRDTRGRPNSAAELIESLCTIAGLPREALPLVVESYLQTPVLVGRDKPSAVLQAALARARAGRGASVLIEAGARMGRTRLLSELGLSARLVSAVVIQADPAGQQSSHGMAELYACKLLAALPDTARSAALPYAPVLGHLSAGLRERLGIREHELADLPKQHGEARMRIQAALCDWFMAVAREHTIVLLADDVHEFDPASTAWLAGLGRQAKSRHLLIVASVRADRAGLHALEGLRRQATALTLVALAAREIEAMLRSVFNDVPHLQRLADLVCQRAEGNPGHALDLIEHLVQQHVVQYVDGTWVLPTEIAAEQLPADSNAVFAARLQRLTPRALGLGRALAVREGPIPFEACVALAELPLAETLDALEMLVRAGVLLGSAEGYRFTREPLRAALLAELDPARKKRVHRISGELLLQPVAATPLQRLQGGLHLLLAGEVERGTRVVAELGQHYGLTDLADVGQAAPALERGLALFLELGRPPHELLSLYAPLALAGYYAERRYADRYGEPTLALLQKLLGLERARRFRRVLGRKPALLLALAGAMLGFRHHRWNPRVPSFRHAIMLLFNCVAALTGVCTVCTDAVRARRYADVLEPMRALGANHVATLMHDFCLNLAATLQDRIGLARARWQAMIERLESKQPIRDLPDDVRTLYLAGALYACGVMESWRDSSRALQFAQRLEDFKLKLYDLSANQIRMLYYAHQGNLELSQKYRERVEVHAIQRGTAWQAETWAFAALVTIYSRTHNALGVKHCVQQLRQLSHEVPSLNRLARSAQGTYLMLRGSPDEALEWFVDEEPLIHPGWARARGSFAAALNMLGQYARAQQVCQDVLSRLGAADLEFPAMNLNVLIELALAEAGLGDPPAAAARLDALIKQHTPFAGPLTLAALQETRMQVAAIMHDQSGVEHHLACMEHWQGVTGDRALIARGARLAKRARATAGNGDAALSHAGEDPLDPSQPLTVVHRLRHGGERSLEGSAEWIIDQLIEYADIRAGHVFSWNGESLCCVASRGDLPAPEVFEHWLLERMTDDLDATTVRRGTGDVFADPDRFSFGERSYRLLRLSASASSGAQLRGALVLSDETLFDIPASVLRVIADRLHASTEHQT